MKISSFQTQHRLVWMLLMLFGALSMAGWVWFGNLTAVSSPILALDLNQHRANVILPIPNSNFSIVQPFLSTHDGLQEIEVTVTIADEPEGNGRLTFTLHDQTDTLITQQTFLNSSFAQTQPLRLRFDPLLNSKNKKFTLHIQGSSQNMASVKGYDLDVLADGDLSISGGALSTTIPNTTAQDLQLKTYYRLTWSESWQTLWQQVNSHGSLWLAALLLLPLPGCMLLLIKQSHLPAFDRPAWWGTAVAISMALWPLIWFFLSLLGGHWSKPSLWATLIVGWVIVIIIWAKKRFHVSTTRSPVHPITHSSPHATFILILILVLGFAVRLLAVRDIAFPLWVDSSRHAVITAVMSQTGQVITNYAPFLLVDQFPYHFGFHTLSASLALMTERPLPDLLLTFGQLLNALVPLSIYTATWLMTRQRRTALFAAFLVAFPFFFPGYYATWGRFTQLTGMIVLPVLVGLSWQLVCGGRRWRQTWWLVGSLAAGLFLVHLRVFLIYLPFVLIVWLMSRGRNGRYLIRAGLLTGLLIGIRAYDLLRLTLTTNSSAKTPIVNYNTFPTSYVEVGWERYYIFIAAGLLVVVVTAVLRRRRWTALPLALISWVGLLFLFLAGETLGIPEWGIINLNSMYITLFFPLAVYLAFLYQQFSRFVNQLPLTVQGLLTLLTGAGLCALLLFGIRQQITILNEQTILAYPADFAGLQWIEENVPSDAKIAAGSWLWLGNTYAGTDGGAWIVQLTGHRSTIPPADYIYDADYFKEINGFNETAVAISDWADLSAAQWLRSQNVTHIFVGAKGGFFDPSALSKNPDIQLLFSQDGVFIFTLTP